MKRLYKSHKKTWKIIVPNLNRLYLKKGQNLLKWVKKLEPDFFHQQEKLQWHARNHIKYSQKIQKSLKKEITIVNWKTEAEFHLLIWKNFNEIWKYF